MHSMNHWRRNLFIKNWILLIFNEVTWWRIKNKHGILREGDSLVAQLLRIHLQCRRPRFNSWVRKIHWRRDRLPTPVFLGFPGGSAGRESACNAGDLGLIPGLRRSGEEKGYPLQYSGLENGVAESNMMEQFSLFWEKSNISMKTVPHLLWVVIDCICR